MRSTPDLYTTSTGRRSPVLRARIRRFGNTSICRNARKNLSWFVLAPLFTCTRNSPANLTLTPPRHPLTPWNRSWRSSRASSPSTRRRSSPPRALKGSLAFSEETCHCLRPFHVSCLFLVSFTTPAHAFPLLFASRFFSIDSSHSAHRYFNSIAVPTSPFLSFPFRHQFLVPASRPRLTARLPLHVC